MSRPDVDLEVGTAYLIHPCFDVGGGGGGGILHARKLESSPCT